MAIKRLRPEFARNQELLNRFLKEARTMARFRHPHIVQILELGEDSLGSFLVMEWIDGRSVADVLRADDRMEPQRVVRIICQVADGLQQAHAAGVVHRDIKPANILLDGADQAYVTDFGLVRIEAESLLVAADTMTGALLGTVEFIAPEQLKDPRQATARSDIWSLAATLYQMVTGFSVRARDDELVPQFLRSVLFRALKPRPEDRFESMADFREALQDAALQGDAMRPPSGSTVGSQPTPDSDLAGLLRQAKQKVDQAHRDARRVAEKQQDYATAVRILESVPEHLRRKSLYDEVVRRRDRADKLETLIRQAVGDLRLEGLRERVAELLQLQPSRTDIRELLAELLAELPDEPVPATKPAGSTRAPALLTAPFTSQQAAASQADWARYLGLDVDVTNSVGMKFRVIPPGTFGMGSPDSESGREANETLHTVTITQPKLLGIYPVTQDEWTRVMGSNPSHFPQVSGQDTARFPVETVTWDEAQAFLTELNRQHAIEGWRYRLPTEAEWEYACRAGTTTAFWFGNELNGKQANCDGNVLYPDGVGDGPFLGHPTHVGQYGANPFGLFDQHGNLWEWCADWYGADYDSTSPNDDPTGPTSGSSRVLRGGSWSSPAIGCRSAYRYLFVPSFRYLDLGFRVLCELV